MKIALVCSLMLAAVFVVQAGDEWCSLSLDMRIAAVTCVHGNIPAEIKEKVASLNKEGIPIPDLIKKHCESGGDPNEDIKKVLSDDEVAQVKKAFLKCASA